MGPIDYSIQVATPFQSALQGYQAGAAIRDDQLAAKIKEQQLLQQQQMQQDLRAFSSIKNPTAADYARITTRYPQLSENFKRSWDMLKPEQQQNELSHASQVYAATLNGRPDVAQQLLLDRATALENAGDPAKARHARTIAELVRLNPDGAKQTVGLMLSAVMDPDKFTDTFGKLGVEQRATEQAPADLKKKTAEAAEAESKAETARIAAKYGEQSALLDLQKKGWDIKAVENDIAFKKEQNRIAAMSAAIARENNQLKRDELKLKVDEARGKLEEKVRERVATAEAGATSIDNMLNTIERIKKNPSLNSVLGSLEGKEYYPNATLGTLNPLGDGDQRSDAIALIDTLGSQAFLAQIPNIKGMGALSNAEGEKLQSALTNLKRTQSEKQFRENLDEAARLLNKGRETLSKSTGVPLKAPDTPAAPGSRPALSSFEKP